MPLIEKLPGKLDKELGARGIPDVDIAAAIQADLTPKGAFGEDWLVLTARRLLAFSHDADGPFVARIDVALEEVRNPVTDSRIGGGALMARLDGQTVEVIRYTLSKARSFNRIAKYLQKTESFFHPKAGQEKPAERPVLEEPKEHESNCPKCGMALREGTSVCPKCLNKRKVIWRIFSYLKPYWKQTSLLWVLILAGTGLSLIPPYLHKMLVDDVIVPGSEIRTVEERIRMLGFLVLALLATRVLGQAFTIARGWILAWLGGRLTHDLRTQVFKHLQFLSLGYFDKRQTGAIMARVSRDTESLQSAILNAAPHVVVEVLTFVGVLTILLVMNWKLTLMVLIPGPFVAILSRLFWKRVHRLWHRFWYFRQRLSASLNESLSGVRVVKAFAQEPKEVSRFDGFSHELFQADMVAHRTHMTLFPILGFIMGLGSLVAWYVGGRDVIGGVFTLGTLWAFQSYLGRIYGPLQWLTRIMDWLVRSLTSAERVFEVLDTQPDVKESAKPVVLSQMKGAIRFENITFGYDKNKPVIHDFSLDVAPGEMIGLVGHSGAGKSTTINLVCRFYDVNEGRIVLDGVDLRNLSQHDLRSQIGIVLQDTFLFNGSIADNIRYAKSDATAEEVMAAARAANAHDFIMQKPDAYDAVVGERGLTLSGGERQRIAIARAILHDPRVLILDEATSSVDTDTEQQIQQAIARLIKGRTTFAIAHRLSTLRNADRLVVLKDGRVEEMGTHDELMEKEGEFHRLVKIQQETSKIKAVDG